MRNNVKLVKIAGENEQKQTNDGNYSGILDNFTFDLTLEEQSQELLNSDLFLSGHVIAPLNKNDDQVDDLLAELNELMGLQQKTESSRMINSESEGMSPFMPRRTSLLDDDESLNFDQIPNGQSIDVGALQLSIDGT